MKKIIEHIKNEWYKYAMEILVLVIGIYGAFALDNWNEDRKMKTFEQYSLDRILVNLKTDRENLIRINALFESAISSSEKILAFEPSNQSKDSLPYWLGNVVQFERFKPLTNTYEMLKSKGLDVLSDQELAYQIGKYYDDDAKRTANAIGDIEQTFNVDWVPLMKQNLEFFKFRERLVLSDWQMIYEGGAGYRIIVLNKDNYTTGSDRIKEVIISMDELIQSIEKILDK